MRRSLIAATLCLSVITPAWSVSAVAQEDVAEGWWIVAGVFPEPDGSIQKDAPVTKTSRRVAQCGVVPFNDFSMKFQGFPTGYQVVVVGPYPDRGIAGRYLDKVRRCAPDAILREGRYLGE